jgi:hypothetical protein
MATSEKKLSEDYDFTRYKKLVIYLVGEDDWKKSKANYIKHFNAFSELDDGKAKLYGIVEDARASIERKQTDYNAGLDIEVIENNAAYLNTCLQQGYNANIVGTKETKNENGKGSKSTTDIINVNLSEINPGWLTYKLINRKRIIEFHNADGTGGRLEINNPNTNSFSPNVETLKLEYVLEQIYYDKISHLPQELRIKDNRKLDLYVKDILERLGWGVDGRSYQKIKTHFHILRQTDMISFKVYKFKETGIVKDIPQSRNFTMIEDLQFYYEKGLEAAEKRLKVRFNLCEFFAINVQNGYFSIIPKKITQQLEAPTEFYLGVLIERRRGKNNSTNPININVNDFVLDSGMITKDPKEQKYNLVTALESLKGKNIIKNFAFKEGLITVYP